MIAVIASRTVFFSNRGRGSKPYRTAKEYTVPHTYAVRAEFPTMSEARAAIQFWSAYGYSVYTVDDAKIAGANDETV